MLNEGRWNERRLWKCCESNEHQLCWCNDQREQWKFSKRLCVYCWTGWFQGVSFVVVVVVVVGVIIVRSPLQFSFHFSPNFFPFPSLFPSSPCSPPLPVPLPSLFPSPFHPPVRRPSTATRSTHRWRQQPSRNINCLLKSSTSTEPATV